MVALPQISVKPLQWEGRSPFGWLQYAISPGNVAALYVGFILSLSFLLIVEYVFRLDFEDTARWRVIVLGKQLSTDSCRSLMGVICLTIFTLILWQLLSAIHRFHLIISSPVEVLQRAYGLVIRGESIPPIETTIWYHFGISLAELLGGLVSSVTAAVLLTQGLSAASKWRRSH